jgi:hypothetical protein
MVEVIAREDEVVGEADAEVQMEEEREDVFQE